MGLGFCKWVAHLAITCSSLNEKGAHSADIVGEADNLCIFQFWYKISLGDAPHHLAQAKQIVTKREINVRFFAMNAIRSTP